MYKPLESLFKRSGNGADILDIGRATFLFALALIQISFMGCYDEPGPLGPEDFIVTDGKFVGRNHEEVIIVIITEKQGITRFTYEFKNASGYSCSSGTTFGTAQEPVTHILNNSFSITRGDNLEFSGTFVTNDSCTGTWSRESENNLCLAKGSTGTWVATRN